MKLTKPSTIIIITIIAIATTIGTILALNQWTQNFNWGNTTDTSFSVYNSATGTALALTTLNLGNVTQTSVITINYFIQNDGNVPIKVSGLVHYNEGGAVVTWNPVGGYVNVEIGTTREVITLTLTDFNQTEGSGTVTFTAEETV